MSHQRARLDPLLPQLTKAPHEKGRQQASPIDKVVELLERQENRAKKQAKKEYKLSKKTVRLHEETNAIQRELVGILRQYITGQQERRYVRMLRQVRAATALTAT